MRINISIEDLRCAIAKHLTDKYFLEVIDETHKHIGHIGHNPDISITHVFINIVTNYFNGINRLQRQRIVNEWLSDFFKAGLHSVSYTLKTPKEVTLT